MKVLFLGTGACDWPLQPEPGREHRRNASVLLDDRLLIDPGPGVPDALQQYGKNPEHIRYILNTHRHGDHFNGQTLQMLEQAGAKFYPMKAGEVLQLGPYEVRAFAANHGTCREAVHFMISDGQHRLFYGLDGAWLLYDEVQAILEHPVDLIVLDGTVGEQEGDYRIFEHNNLRMVREMKLTLQPYVRRFCISHMAKTLHPSHKILAARMAEDQIEVAFDGWETTIL